MKLLVVGFIALLMTGCAARWEHAEKRQSDFFVDDRDCQVIAGGASRGVEPGTERTSYESCMWERGWRKKRTIWFFDPVER